MTERAKEPGQTAYEATAHALNKPWFLLTRANRAQYLIIEAAIRASALEDAAKKAESLSFGSPRSIAAAIRALIPSPGCREGDSSPP